MQQVRQLAQALLDNLQPMKQAFEPQYGALSALQRIEQVVIKQCKKALL